MRFPRVLLSLAPFLAWVPFASAALEVQPLMAARAWMPVELRVTGVPDAANPFDPDVIRVDATVTRPSGRTITVPGFWYQEYTRRLERGVEHLSTEGEPEWRVRFTAEEPGPHRIRVTVTLQAGAGPGPVDTSLEVAPPAPEAAPGWVRVAADGRTFATSEGQPLLLAGHNICWPGAGGTFAYDAWFAELAAAGQNFVRLWLAPWWAPLEHVPGTLTRYRLDAAWQLDQVFAAAERHGLYVLLCLDHHGMYQPVDPTWGGSNAYWRSNPYSAEQGGPCAEPADFFTDPAALAAYQKRLRYLIGRYGASPRLVAWQFFNEIDNIFDRAPVAEEVVVAWHVEMARWLRLHDPYEHIIGTSLTGGVDRPSFWELPEMEFTSYHAYWEPAPVRRVAALAADFTRRYGKPALIGEFGVSGAHWDAPADPHLRGFRQHLWAGALGGSAATSLSWWWEDVHRDGALRLEQVLTTFLREAGWFEGGWTPLTIEAATAPPKTLDAPVPDAPSFQATLALNPFRRLRLDGEFAVGSPLAAERASEHLSSVLWGSAEPGAQRPLRITVWAGEGARLIVRIQEATGPAAWVVRIDGQEVARERVAAAGPVGREFTHPLAAGLRRIEIANEGVERLQLAAIRFENLRPATSPQGWRYRPEAIGLRRADRGLLYVVAPAAVYPAGAIRYELPAVRGEVLALPDWPAGRYRVRWLDTETGAVTGEAAAETRAGVLSIAVPDLRVDAAARIDPW